jgi:hypothetical protein
LKGVKRFDAEKTKSGEDAADESGSDGEEDGECENGEVDGDGLRARDGELGVSGELVNGEEGESDAENAAGDGEEENFGESALQDAGGGGSEGGANGGFAVATDEAGELRVGEVDAGDKKHAEDRGHEEPETRGGFADENFFHGLDVGGEGAVGRAVKLAWRDLARESVIESVEVLLGLGDGDAGFEASERNIVAVVAVEAEVVEVDREWSEEFVVGELTGEGNWGEFVGFGKVEIFRQDTYDLIGCAGDLDGSASDIGVGVVERLPEMPGEDGDFFPARGGLFREEVASEDWLDAEDVEKIGKRGDLAD